MPFNFEQFAKKFFRLARNEQSSFGGADSSVFRSGNDGGSRGKIAIRYLDFSYESKNRFAIIAWIPSI